MILLSLTSMDVYKILSNVLHLFHKITLVEMELFFHGHLGQSIAEGLAEVGAHVYPTS